MCNNTRPSLRFAPFGTVPVLRVYKVFTECPLFATGVDTEIDCFSI